MISADTIAITKDLVVIIAAIVGAKIAMRGLDTWRRQLQGTNEHDLSRDILVKLYRYRDAIGIVRNPLMLSSEIPAPPESDDIKMDHHERRFYGTSKAYEARWDKVREERKSLYGELLEAEAFWGKELENLFKDIYKLEYGLYLVVNELLVSRNPDSHEDDKKFANEYLRDNKKTLYSYPRKGSDEFGDKFLTLTVKIENYLKPKIDDSKT